MNGRLDRQDKPYDFATWERDAHRLWEADRLQNKEDVRKLAELGGKLTGLMLRKIQVTAGGIIPEDVRLRLASQVGAGLALVKVGRGDVEEVIRVARRMYEDVERIGKQDG